MNSVSSRMSGKIYLVLFSLILFFYIMIPFLARGEVEKGLVLLFAPLILILLLFAAFDKKILMGIILTTLALRPILEYYFTKFRIFGVGSDGLFIGILTGIMLFVLLSNRKAPFRRLPLTKYFILWLVWLGMSAILYTRAPMQAIHDWALLLSFFLLVVYFSKYLTVEKVQIVLILIVTSSIYPMIFSFLELYSGSGFSLREGLTVYRIGGFFAGYNYGMYLWAIFLVAGALYLSATRKIWKYFGAIMALLILVSILLTASRTAFFFSLLGMFVLFLFAGKLKQGVFLFSVVLFAFVIVSFLSIPYFQNSLAHMQKPLQLDYFRIEGRESSIASRLTMYNWILHAAMRRPIFGYGLSNFQFFEPLGRAPDASSSLMLLLFENGFLGAFLLVVIVLKSIKDGLATLKSKIRTSNERIYLAMLVAACVSGLGAAMLEMSMLGSVKGFYFWIIVGIGYSIILRSR